MRKSYPSDTSRGQFVLIQTDLETFRKTTKPREIDLYEVFCSILYKLKEGCTWRALPHDFPDWNLVYYYYQAWSTPDENGESLIDRLMRELVGMERVCDGRAEQTTMLIVDSRSVKNADTAEEKGYDSGKKQVE